MLCLRLLSTACNLDYLNLFTSEYYRIINAGEIITEWKTPGIYLSGVTSHNNLNPTR